MGEVTIRFEHDRETKRTHRYAEVGTDHVGTLYVQKTTTGSTPPPVLVMTLKEGA